MDRQESIAAEVNIGKRGNATGQNAKKRAVIIISLVIGLLALTGLVSYVLWVKLHGKSSNVTPQNNALLQKTGEASDAEGKNPDVNPSSKILVNKHRGTSDAVKSPNSYPRNDALPKITSKRSEAEYKKVVSWMLACIGPLNEKIVPNIQEAPHVVNEYFVKGAKNVVLAGKDVHFVQEKLWEVSVDTSLESLLPADIPDKPLETVDEVSRFEAVYAYLASVYNDVAKMPIPTYSTILTKERFDQELIRFAKYLADIDLDVREQDGVSQVDRKDWQGKKDLIQRAIDTKLVPILERLSLGCSWPEFMPNALLMSAKNMQRYEQYDPASLLVKDSSMLLKMVNFLIQRYSSGEKRNLSIELEQALERIGAAGYSKPDAISGDKDKDHKDISASLEGPVAGSVKVEKPPSSKNEETGKLQTKREDSAVETTTKDEPTARRSFGKFAGPTVKDAFQNVVCAYLWPTKDNIAKLYVDSTVAKDAFFGDSNLRIPEEFPLDPYKKLLVMVFTKLGLPPSLKKEEKGITASFSADPKYISKERILEILGKVLGDVSDSKLDAHDLELIGKALHVFARGLKGMIYNEAAAIKDRGPTIDG